MSDNSVVSITQRLKERKLKEQLKDVVERDEDKWPILKGRDIPSLVLTTLRIINIPDAGALFLSKDWFGTLCALGEQCKRWDSAYVLDNVCDYWYGVDCHYTYDGFEIVKLGTSISVIHNGVVIYRDGYAAKNIHAMSYIYGFMDGWNSGKKKGASKSVRDAISLMLMKASLSEIYISTFYIDLMRILSDNSFGHFNGMTFNQCCDLFKRSWVEILTAYELDDEATLKNYPSQLIAMVITVVEWPKIALNKEDVVLVDYFTALVRHIRGWDVCRQIGDENMYLHGLTSSDIIPYQTTLFGMRDWLIDTTKVSVEEKKKSGEFIS